MGTAPEQKTESAKDGKDSMSLPSFQSLRVQQVAPTSLCKGGKRFIYIIWRGLAALSKSKNSVSCETLHILNTRVGATANAFVLLKFSIKELLQQQLPYQKINYYFTLICVTSLSCEKVHRTFSTKIKQRFLRNAAYFGHSCWRNRQRFRLIKIFD